MPMPMPMPVRSGGRKFSFNLLAGDSSGDERSLLVRQGSDDVLENGGHVGRSCRRRHKSKAAKKKAASSGVAAEDPRLLSESDGGKVVFGENGYHEDGMALASTTSERRSVLESVSKNTVVQPEFKSSQVSSVAHVELRQRKLSGSVHDEQAAEEPRLLSELDGEKRSLGENSSCEIRWGFRAAENRLVLESACESTVVEMEHERSQVTCDSHVELRQRNLNGSITDDIADEESSTRESSTGQWMPESNGCITKLETTESLDWKRVLAEDPNLLGEVFSVERSPWKYFIGEIYGGNSLRSTISVGNDKKRQRVYNTMFHVPLRCERLIVAGFFVCLDSFLSLLTIMPARILMTIWRVLRTRI